MREIKFRAWKKDAKEMYQIKYLDCGKVPSDSNEVVMQFTGLKDKNGKEIYEGDIILTNTFVLFKEKGNKNCGGYGFFGIDSGKYPLGDYDGMDDFEVIGNIYENPELLERSVSTENPKGESK